MMKKGQYWIDILNPTDMEMKAMSKVKQQSIQLFVVESSFFRFTKGSLDFPYTSIDDGRYYNGRIEREMRSLQKLYLCLFSFF